LDNGHRPGCLEREEPDPFRFGTMQLYPGKGGGGLLEDDSRLEFCEPGTEAAVDA